MHGYKIDLESLSDHARCSHEYPLYLTRISVIMLANCCKEPARSSQGSYRLLPRIFYDLVRVTYLARNMKDPCYIPELRSCKTAMIIKLNQDSDKEHAKSCKILLDCAILLKQDSDKEHKRSF